MSQDLPELSQEESSFGSNSKKDKVEEDKFDKELDDACEFSQNSIEEKLSMRSMEGQMSPIN